MHRFRRAAALIAAVLAAGCGGDDDEDGAGRSATARDTAADVAFRVEGAKVTVTYGPRARDLAERAKQVGCAAASPEGRLDVARADLMPSADGRRATGELDRDISEQITLCQLEGRPEQDLATAFFRKP